MVAVTVTGETVVVGGGIGGLACALALRRCGWEVTVAERATEPAGAGAGLMLYPNGVAALDAISPALGARIRRVGHVVGAGEVRLLLDSAGRILAREPIGAVVHEFGLPMVAVLRSVLQLELAEEARRAGVRIRHGAVVRSYRTTEERAWVATADDRELGADLVVGADGLRSVVRARMVGQSPPQYRGYSSVRGRSPLAGEPATFVANGRGLQLFVSPVAPGLRYWTAKITAPPGVWPRMGAARAHEALLDLVADWDPPVARMIAASSPEELAVSDIHDRAPLRRWADGRVVLLGDAAHPMVPALGQGANMALEDAVVLATALGEAGEVGAGLRAYQSARVARTAPVVLQSRRQGAMDQGAGRLRARLRDRLMRRRGAKDASARAVMGWRPQRALTGGGVCG